MQSYNKKINDSIDNQMEKKTTMEHLSFQTNHFLSTRTNKLISSCQTKIQLSQQVTHLTHRNKSTPGTPDVPKAFIQH